MVGVILKVILMKYEHDLIKALEDYGEIDKELTILETKKSVLRSQIRDWMSLNELENFEIQDGKNQVWKMKFDEQMRKSISDWSMLEKILGEKNENLIVRRVISSFTIKSLKSFSKEWLLNNK